MTRLWFVALLAACSCGSEDITDPAPPPEATPPETSSGFARPGRPGATAQEPRPSEPARPSSNDERGVAGRLSWRATEPLVQRPPASQMRAAEYTVRGSTEATLAVFFFGPGQGGGIDDNIDRWVGQFAQPDGRSGREAAEIEHREVNGIRVTRIELTGTFSGGMGPMQAGPAREGWKLLGAIAEGPDAPVFFKLTGPATDVDRAEQAFDELIASIDRL